MEPTETNFAAMLWAEAERTGNTPTLCAATAFIALVEAATDTKPMSLEVAQAAVSLLAKPLADGLGTDYRKFLEFTLQLAETRIAAYDDTPRH